MTLANGIITAINGKYDDETQINAKILSGQEEALNRWISTNYIDGRLERSAVSWGKREKERRATEIEESLARVTRGGECGSWAKRELGREERGRDRSGKGI